MSAMMAMLDTDDARRSGDGQRRELPVLFHLIDVSRARAPATPAESSLESIHVEVAVPPIAAGEPAGATTEIPLSKLTAPIANPFLQQTLAPPATEQTTAAALEPLAAISPASDEIVE